MKVYLPQACQILVTSLIFGSPAVIRKKRRKKKKKKKLFVGWFANELCLNGY